MLHYHVTRPPGHAVLARLSRNMDIPDSLRHRIELFRETGRVFRVPNELFAENSWIQVMLGQGIEPRQHHPVADLMGDEELARFLDGIKIIGREDGGATARAPGLRRAVLQGADMARSRVKRTWRTSMKSRSWRACRSPPFRESSIRAPRSARRRARRCSLPCSSSATSRIPSRSRWPRAAPMRSACWSPSCMARSSAPC